MGNSPLRLGGLRELTSLFDNFIVDQFGVLHDGDAPYPGAVEALASLKEAGKTVLLLSNSGRRSGPNEERLQHLGFPRGSWDFFLSSGELAWRQLAKKYATGERKRCLQIARGTDRSAVEDLPLVPVDNGDEADIVLISGSDGDRHDLEYYRSLLMPAARRGVECLCTNPDKMMLTPVGLRFGAGRIAEVYEELGGRVTWIGKPFPQIYEAALQMLGQPLRLRTMVVGDSIEHDIAGGAAAGLSSVLVETGVLHGLTYPERSALFEEHGATPNYLLSSFIW